MRGQKDICLLCRRASRVSSLRGHARGNTTWSKTDPYDLPRLVIDLDANDSKYVRRAEDIDPREFSKLGGSDRVRRFTGKEKQRYLRAAASLDDAPLTGSDENGDTFPTRITTPLDLFHYALEGDPRKHPSPVSSILQEILREKRIPVTDTPDDKFLQLLHNFSVDDSSNLRGARFEVPDEEFIKIKRRRFTSFQDLHRTISMLSSTVEGCSFLSENMKFVAPAIEACRKAGKLRTDPARAEFIVTSVRVVTLLNNLCINMKSKGVEIGSDFCNIGLHYSAKAFQLQSIKMYLEIMVANKYPTNRYTKSAIAHLSLNVGRPQTFHSQRNGLAFGGIDPKQAVSSLLTGWESDDRTISRSASFASLVIQDANEDLEDSLYPALIIALGQISESAQLLDEVGSLNDAYLPLTLRGIENLRNKAGLLAIGHILAGHSHHAAEVLKTGFLQMDGAPDAQVMKRILESFYDSRQLQVQPTLNSELDRVIGNDWESALDKIKRLVLYNLPATEISSDSPRFIDWIEGDNGKGSTVVGEHPLPSSGLEEEEGVELSPAASSNAA